MSSLRSFTYGLLAAVWITSSGCGPNLVKVGGKVTVDGTPVKEGSIMFCPTTPGRPATARIMEDGTFTLSFENPGDGLPPGEYRVVIVADVWKEGKRTKQQEYDEANLKKQGIDDPSSVQAGGILTHIVPPEYNDIKTTPLTRTVDRTTTHFEFDIAYRKKK